MSRLRLIPKGGSVRCNLLQASRSSCVDRSSKPAISASMSLGPGFRARLLRLPPRLGTGNGPPVSWRADGSGMAGVLRPPALLLRRSKRKPQLLLQGSREETSDRVPLPPHGARDFLDGYTFRALQH